MLLKLSTLLVAFEFVFAKVYDRCELAKELRHVHDFPEKHISTWICIVQHESQFDTKAMNFGSGDHGLFQISQLYWCSPKGVGSACNAACYSFKDDDITDDVRCVKKIYKEHTRLSGNGFDAWAVYPLYCRGDTSKYIGGCPQNEIDNTISSAIEENVPIDEDGDGYDFPPLPSAPKVYGRCELAKELKNVYKFPEEQISKWVCIAEHESNYNTSANNKGSGDHGLFQISEQYWCSPYGRGLGCNANCASFRDRSIADDVQCIRVIYEEHTAISGNGFNAWVVYPQYCKGDTSRYIRGCFPVHDDGYDFPPLPIPPKNVINNVIDNGIEDDGVYRFPSLPTTPRTVSIHHSTERKFTPSTHSPSTPTLNVDIVKASMKSSYFSPSPALPKSSKIPFEKKKAFQNSFNFDNSTQTIPKSDHTIQFSSPSLHQDTPSVTPSTNTPSYISSTQKISGITFGSNVIFKNSSNLSSNIQTTSTPAHTFDSSSPSSYRGIVTTEGIVLKSSTYNPHSNLTTKTFRPITTTVTPVSTSPFSQDRITDNVYPSPKPRQLTFEHSQPFTLRPRAGFPRHTRPTGVPPRPSRPSRPAGGPPRPPPRPSRPQNTRPGPPPPPPGPIFTLWPTSFTGPVATSVYSTSPKPLGKLLNTDVGALTYSASDQSTIFAPSRSSIKPVSSTTLSSTVKRSDRISREQFPGYSFSRTRLGFSLFHNSKK